MPLPATPVTGKVANFSWCAYASSHHPALTSAQPWYVRIRRKYQGTETVQREVLPADEVIISSKKKGRQVRRGTWTEYNASHCQQRLLTRHCAEITVKKETVKGKGGGEERNKKYENQEKTREEHMREREKGKTEKRSNLRLNGEEMVIIKS